MPDETDLLNTLKGNVESGRVQAEEFVGRYRADWDADASRTFGEDSYRAERAAARKTFLG